MDYLPVQATSVPCEHVFSLVKEMDTNKQNRISPILIEALQLLKFSLKKECLDFTRGWATLEVAMLGVAQPTWDLLGSLLVKEPDNVVDDILHTISSYDCN